MGHICFPGVASAQFRVQTPNNRPSTFSVAIGMAVLLVLRLGLYPSAPGSLSHGGANSFTSGTVRPRRCPQTNGPLSLGHGSWFVWPDPPGSLCAGSSGHRELGGETQWAGAEKQAAILSEARAVGSLGARRLVEAGEGVSYRISAAGAGLVSLQSVRTSPMLAKAVSLK